MKRKDRKNEEIKFLGVDGFEEIESLSPYDAPKNNPRSTARKKTDRKAKKSSFFKASEDKLQPAHMVGVAPVKRVYKKRVVLIVAAGVSVAMISAVTAAGALNAASSGKAKPEITETQAETQPQTTYAAVPTIPSTLDEPVSLIGRGGDKANGGSSYNIGSGACALYIDGEFIGVVNDGRALVNALDKVLSDAREGYDSSTTTEFANKVEVKPYDGGEAPVSVDAIMEETQYMYSIRLETDWIYEEEVEHGTEVTVDESLPDDYEEIIQDGQDGVVRYTVRLSYIDGEDAGSKVTDERTVIETIPEKKLVGSAKAKESEESTESTDSSQSEDSYSGDDHSSSDSGSYYGSGFIWPLPHTHNITSYMGERWGRMHCGIDIAGGDDYGQPIIAADSGTVIWSGNDGGGYGNYVMIDHGNGYVTVYGHASELACSTGDYVSQGDVIAYVGSTGNSTGPHLHFEIRYDGEYLNPLDFVY